MPISPLRTLTCSGMSVLVYADAGTASRATAEMIRDCIVAAVLERDRAVLGLATGATPQKVYAQLVAWYEARELSFRKVVTYNLDEYYPIHPLDPKSYRSYMYQHFFGRVDMPPNQAHLLDGTVPIAFAAEHCAEFDRWIQAEGGIDLQLLGIGRNGHIGFNEPSELPLAEALARPTRLVDLHQTTKEDAAKEFGGIRQVIPKALTMGVAPILAARSILMLATGAHKSEIVNTALHSQITAQVPATLLQTAGNRVTWLLDQAAASAL